MKKKVEKEKKINKMVAEGTITREELNKDKEDRKEGEKVKDEIVVDESGKARDKDGNIIFVENRATDLLINQKKEQEKSKRELEGKSRVKVQQRVSRQFFDKNLYVGTRNKKLRIMNSGLSFLEKGAYNNVD